MTLKAEVRRGAVLTPVDAPVSVKHDSTRKSPAP